MSWRRQKCYRFAKASIRHVTLPNIASYNQTSEVLKAIDCLQPITTKSKYLAFLKGAKYMGYLDISITKQFNAY